MSPAPEGPAVRRVRLELPAPTDADHAGDLDRLLRGLSAQGLHGVRTPLPVLAALPRVLRSSAFAVAATVSLLPEPTLLGVEPAPPGSRTLGLAVDLGSTNVVAALLDLETGEALGELSALNPQVAHGEDILSRIHFCRGEEDVAGLQVHAVAAINDLAERLAAGAAARPDEICCVSVAGNTTMGHFLLGLDPRHLCRAPYVPAANRFPAASAGELGLRAHPRAPVLVLPNVGSYVGGDILAGVLVSGMHRGEEVALLVDIGTNAEIVVGNRDFLLVGAGSAGPGLEGGVVRHGMRAAPGAIERVRIAPDSLLPSWSVIGGGPPRGMCGSALIDLVAELFLNGIVDERGRFVLPARSPRVRERGGVPCYVVAEAGEGADGEEIFLCQGDLANLLMSKAAMYTMLTVMAEAAGVRFEELARFFIAGAFGAYVDAGRAVAIGMVPDIPLERYRLLGNSSLEGAKRVLRSAAALEEIGEIGRRMTYVEMNTSREFMSAYTAALFLPHTDAGRFPSVRAKAARG